MTYRQTNRLFLSYLLGVLFLPVSVALVCAMKSCTTQEKVPAFKAGEILEPDYAHTNTLIVVDADGLNKSMEKQRPETDGEIMQILSVYCISK